MTRPTTTPASVPPDLFAPLDTTPANVVADYVRDRSLSSREGGEGGGGPSRFLQIVRSVPLSSELPEKGEPIKRSGRKGEERPRVLDRLDRETWAELFRASPRLEGATVYRTPAILPDGSKLEVGVTGRGKMFFKLSRLLVEGRIPSEAWRAAIIEPMLAALGGQVELKASSASSCIETAAYRYRPDQGGAS